MSSFVRLTPPTRPFDLALAPPGSKSLTNRAMVLAALAAGESTLRNALFADDTRVMIDCLRKLGFDVRDDETAQTIVITGRGGEIPAGSAELFCGNSGTTIRFVAALCSLGHGRFTLDGIERMRQRPIGPLVGMLNNLAARVRHLGSPCHPPIELLADGLPGGNVRYGSETSSQYLSAVLHVAPLARHETRIYLDGKQTSWPYVEMTMRLMDEFGVLVELERDPVTHDPKRIILPAARYAPRDLIIEPDASNATYFLAAAALVPGSRISIDGLGTASLQGDVAFAHLLRRMGASVKVERHRITVEGTDTLEAIDADFSNIPDTAQTFAVLACFAEGASVLRGLHTLRVKETDRVAALQNELTKLGAEVEIVDDTMTIHPPTKPHPASIDTYDDHRMAMSFSLAGLRVSGVRINDPACVNKTFPSYFDRLRELGVGVS